MTSLMWTKSRNILESTDHGQYDATIGLTFGHADIIARLIFNVYGIRNIFLSIVYMYHDLISHIQSSTYCQIVVYLLYVVPYIGIYGSSSMSVL